ncbi:hypothetical protein HI914_00401 [Erysiphe necator]|uniref:Putative short-chain dehydrogenase protein n=1 Tax=Uncinula necator TaxID=52586 RepID=A0A0B1P2R7_UNCNE|nr:hypothetical protein HI914_00401 [Erysiphe necator]KHJ30954.1 putative short-chain dehydrogenase protein [Erysiphe necator]
MVSLISGTNPKSIILTGASRGIGLAIARYLLLSGNRVLCIARTKEPLDNLQKEFPEQVAILMGDMKDFQLGAQAVAKALQQFKCIDGLIINHGSLSPLKRLADSDPLEWRSAFEVNFFSAIALIQPALPSLRETKGRIIITSSGAALKSYATWGAYGSAKAALNHLVQTLAAEEPLITSIAVRPGVVDTEMQAEIRGNDNVMDQTDAEKFRKLYREGRLLRPEQPGDVMARLVLGAGREFSGKFLSWDAADLAKFQD